MSDYPTIRPRLLLDFANSKKLDRRITFRRSSTGTYVGADGLIKTANIDEPRFDHDPVTGVCKGLLVEESRTNLILNSGNWQLFATTQQNITALANTVLAPDNLTTAKELQSTSTSSASSYQTVSLVAGVQYTLSVYVKAGTHTSAQLRLWDSNFFATATFSFSIGTSSGGIIQRLPNGWFRCSVTGTANTTTGLGRAYFEFQNPVTASSTLYFFGAQLEAGSFPTSYIPTTASTVTRSADLATMTGTNFSSWFSPNVGTFFVDGDVIGEKNNTTPSTFIGLGTPANDSFATFFNYDNRVTVGFIAPSIPFVPNYLDLTGKRFRAATAFDNVLTANSRASSAIDGVSYSVNTANNYDVTGIPSSVGGYDRLGIGFLLRAPTIANPINGHIYKVSYWPKRLPDAQLQALTRR